MELLAWSGKLSEELKDLKYDNFANEITKELLKQQEFERLRAEEKELNWKIKKVTEDERKANDENAKQQAEEN